MSQVIFERQPIYNNVMGVFAYQITITRKAPDLKLGSDRNSEMITLEDLDYINTNDINYVASSRLVFVCVDHEELLKVQMLGDPKGTIVLVLCGVEQVSEKLIHAVNQVKDKGYKVALNNSWQVPGVEGLLPLLDYIKLDIERFSLKQLKTWLKKSKRKTRIIASNIQSTEKYRNCLEQGADYIQGYFLSQPRIIKQMSSSAECYTVLEALVELVGALNDTKALETLLSNHRLLSHRLLRFINSPVFNYEKKLESVDDALSYCGRDEIFKWSLVIFISQINISMDITLRTALIRAKICERLAELSGQGDGLEFFTLGIISVLDILLGYEISAILRRLPLDAEMNLALSESTGAMGAALKCVKQIEDINWEGLKFPNLNAEIIKAVCVEGVQWGVDLSRAVTQLNQYYENSYPDVIY